MQKVSLFLFLLIAGNFVVVAQKVAGKLLFEQGTTYFIEVDAKNTLAQQAMGQAIDFTIDGKAAHKYRVTNLTADNITLRHEVTSLDFEFDGMGQQRSFKSGDKNDMDGQFGKPVKEILATKYDMVIDPTGKALLSKPEKIELSKTDDRARIVTDLLRDLTSIVYPPQKGEASFFNVLPAEEVGIGDSWTQTRSTETEKSTTVNTLSAITDSTIEVDFKTTSNSVIKSELVGTTSTTTMNSIATGKILLNKATGIIMEKNSTVESTGTTEMMGTSMPVTSKTTIRIKVTPGIEQPAPVRSKK